MHGNNTSSRVADPHQTTQHQTPRVSLGVLGSRECSNSSRLSRSGLSRYMRYVESKGSDFIQINHDKSLVASNEQHLTKGLPNSFEQATKEEPYYRYYQNNVKETNSLPHLDTILEQKGVKKCMAYVLSRASQKNRSGEGNDTFVIVDLIDGTICKHKLAPGNFRGGIVGDMLEIKGSKTIKALDAKIAKWLTEVVIKQYTEVDIPVDYVSRLKHLEKMLVVEISETIKVTDIQAALGKLKDIVKKIKSSYKAHQASQLIGFLEKQKAFQKAVDVPKSLQDFAREVNILEGSAVIKVSTRIKPNHANITELNKWASRVAPDLHISHAGDSNGLSDIIKEFRLNALDQMILVELDMSKSSMQHKIAQAIPKNMPKENDSWWFANKIYIEQRMEYLSSQGLLIGNSSKTNSTGVSLVSNFRDRLFKYEVCDALAKSNISEKENFNFRVPDPAEKVNGILYEAERLTIFVYEQNGVKHFCAVSGNKRYSKYFDKKITFRYSAALSQKQDDTYQDLVAVYDEGIEV